MADRLHKARKRIYAGMGASPALRSWPGALLPRLMLAVALIGLPATALTLRPSFAASLAPGSAYSSSARQIHSTENAPTQDGPGVWTATGSLLTARADQIETLLPSGKLLVAGGVDSSQNAVASAELYDPAAGTWTATGNMTTPRAHFSATLLPSGLVLVEGGDDNHLHGTASAELYDPTTGAWTATSAMQVARYHQTATLLNNGTVLVAGGFGDSGILSSAEIYNPQTGAWSRTGSMNAQRAEDTATLLNDGTVLVAGSFQTLGPLKSAEIYNPQTGTWSRTGSMNDARHNHTATLLSDGRVLIAGGTGGVTQHGLASAEIYDPSTRTFASTGSLNIGRTDQTATLLTANTCTLSAGGYATVGTPLASAELYNSSTGDIGKVLLAGGYSGVTYNTYASAELFDPQTGTWTETGSMTSPRTDFTMAELPCTSIPTPTTTSTSTDTATSTNTPAPPTITPTNTNTPVLPTATPTSTRAPGSPTVTPTSTTSVPPTNTSAPTATPSSTTAPGETVAGETATSTSVPGDTATSTSVPGDTATNTSVAGNTATNTSVPAAATATSTSTIAPTATQTSAGETQPSATSTSAQTGGSAGPPSSNTAGGPTSPIFVLAPSTSQNSQTSAGATNGQPSLQLDRARASIGDRMCATGTGFQPDEPVTLAVDGVAVTAANASSQGGFMWCFTVPGNVVAGANDASAAGADDHGIAFAHFTGVPANAGTFYFVGASTAGGDETLIALLNPQDRTGQVQLQFFLPTGTSFLRTLTVRAHAQTMVALSPYVHDVRGFGLRVQANPLVAAQMIVQRGRANPYTMLGSGLLEKSWYVAEGYTSLSFHETIYVLNPGSSTATVTLHLLPANGHKGRDGSYRVPAGHTYAINVNKLDPHAAVAAHVTSSLPIMVNRVLTFGTGNFGATSGGGAALAATTWLFAEGEATNTRQTFLDVLNAGKKRAQVTATLYDTDGRRVGSRVLTVDPLHRGTVRLNDVTHASSFATYVTSSAPIVAERPIYFGDPNHGRTGGTVASGRNGTGTQWTFPAGDTTHGANEYLLVLNPNRGTLLLHATFYLSSGQVVTRSFNVPGHARLAIDVRHAVQDVSNTLHGAQLTSANKVSFVAEQSIYNEARTTGYSTDGLAQ